MSFSTVTPNLSPTILLILLTTMNNAGIVAKHCLILFYCRINIFAGQCDLNELYITTAPLNGAAKPIGSQDGEEAVLKLFFTVLFSIHLIQNTKFWHTRCNRAGKYKRMKLALHLNFPSNWL